jgi:hypothetical protein
MVKYINIIKFKNMKTLKLSDEKALELYKTADDSFKSLLEENFGKEFFKPKLITEKVFDIETLCQYLEIDENELYIFKKNTKDKHERHINACNILPKIAQVYNEGEILNWKNTNVYKYLPYLNFSHSGGVVVFTHWRYILYGSFGLYYKTNELCESSYNNFQSVWEDYWGIKTT